MSLAALSVFEFANATADKKLYDIRILSEDGMLVPSASDTSLETRGQMPYLQMGVGVLRMPVGKGRHSPIATDDQGRAIAAILKVPEAHVGKTIPLSGPVEMVHVHEQMAAQLSEALGRKIVFQDLPIAVYCASLETMGVPACVVQHLSGAMEDYQNSVMSGADDNVERLAGRRSSWYPRERVTTRRALR